MKKSVFTILFFLFCTVGARAVIVYGGDGTQNTTALTDDPGWANVGLLNGATGVYIGSYASGYWVLTATHVGSGNITLGGTTYNVVAGSGVQVSGDLYAFRIDTDPLLPTLSLASVRPTNGSAVVLIGDGLNRASSLTTWYVDVDTNPNTWSTSFFAGADGTVTGYRYGSGNTLRWGSNTIDGTASYNIGTGVTSGLYVDFNAVTGESQGAPGDSGGALFYKNSSTWELAGILSAIGTFSGPSTLNGQPSGTAVVGNVTYAIDLSNYSGALSAIIAIPEPSTWAVTLGAGALGLAVWRRRRTD